MSLATPFSSSPSASKRFLKNHFAAVSEMIQSCSGPTVACRFLPDRRRTGTGARVAETFTEKRTKDNRRGYYDCAISLAARHATCRPFGVGYLGSPHQAADTDGTHTIFLCTKAKSFYCTDSSRKRGKLHRRTGL